MTCKTYDQAIIIIQIQQNNDETLLVIVFSSQNMSKIITFFILGWEGFSSSALIIIGLQSVRLYL